MTSILIMDDDDKFRKMLREMLETSGYEVLEAPNGGGGDGIIPGEPNRSHHY